MMQSNLTTDTRPTVNDKQPIVNGSINPTLTADELTQFDTDTKRTALWSLKVGTEFAHHYEDVEPSIFTPLRYELSYDELKEADDALLDWHIRELTRQSDDHRREMEAQTGRFFYQLGREFHEAQKKFRIAGEFRMTLSQLCGYITAEGAGNSFDPVKVKPVLRCVDRTFPRLDYGLNNPNTGRRQHFWTIENATIRLKVDYLKGEAMETVRAWFKVSEPVIRTHAVADEVSLIVNDFSISETDIAYDATVRLWWD
jgi:hypothetical protein